MSPGRRVERRERLLHQYDLAEAGGFCRLRRQISRNVIEGGRDGQHHLAVRQVQVLALIANRVAEAFLHVFEIATRAVERGQFLFVDF
jgi:hypothetical protein